MRSADNDADIAAGRSVARAIELKDASQLIGKPFPIISRMLIPANDRTGIRFTAGKAQFAEGHIDRRLIAGSRSA